MNGKNQVLVVVDRLSGWLEFYALKSKRTEEIKKALFYNWFCRFGFPCVVHGDNESSFISDEMEASAVWNKNPGVKARVPRSMRLHYKSVRHHRKAAASHNLGHSMERTAPGSWKPSRTATRLRETAN